MLLIAALPLIATQTYASGLSGGASSGTGSGRAGAPREVDQVYEFGKALYLGRAPGSKKISYCVKVDDQPKKLRGRTLRSYRGSKQLDFANALIDCDQPEQLALLGVKKKKLLMCSTI